MWWLVVLLSLLGGTAAVEARLQKVAVVLRVPKRSPVSEGGSYPSASKLDVEETAACVSLGRRLRELYMRSSRLVPSDFDSSLVVFHSASSARAMQAAQSVGAGLYPSFDSGLSDFLPVSHAGEEDLLRPCHAAEEDDNDAEDEVRQLKHELAERIHAQEDIGGDWILESAYGMGNSSSALDDRIRAAVRQRLAKRASSSSPPPQSRLAHEVYVRFFASSAQNGLRLFVLDEDGVFADFGGGGGEEEEAEGFPLPRALLVELHDEAELDAHSLHQYVRLLRAEDNGEKALRCCTPQQQGGEDEYCEASAYIASIASRLQSREEWERACRPLEIQDDAAASASAADTTHSPTAAAAATVLVPPPPPRPVNQDNTTTTTTVITCPPVPYVPPPQEDDFFMGFLLGSLLSAILMYWCCVSGSSSGGDVDPARMTPPPLAAASLHHLPHDKAKMDGLEDHHGSSSSSSGVPGALASAPTTGKRRSHVVMHIPRHGDPTLLATTPSSSAMVVPSSIVGQSASAASAAATLV